jgi:hypothetical protein
MFYNSGNFVVTPKPSLLHLCFPEPSLYEHYRFKPLSTNSIKLKAEISGSHGVEDDDVRILGCNAMWT